MTIKNDKAIKGIEKAFKNVLENDQRALELSQETWHKMLVDGTDLETVIKVENVVYSLVKSIGNNDSQCNQAIEHLNKLA